MPYWNLDGSSDDESLTELEKCGVAIEPTPVTALHGEGDRLAEIELGVGRTSPVVYISPPTNLNIGIAEQLDCPGDPNFRRNSARKPLTATIHRRPGGGCLACLSASRSGAFS